MRLISLSACRSARLIYTNFAILCLVVLSACNMATTGDLYEGVVMQQPQYEEIAGMREYRACVDESMLLDQIAQDVNMAARYLASARLMEKCENEFNADALNVGKEERLRAGALSVQNYLKGGDVVSAQARLDWLKHEFPNSDLYFEDGSSFIETMDVLLNSDSNSAVALANVSSEVRAEVRRISYWRQN